MAGIDSLLSLVVQQSADELRLGTDVAPKMFQTGAPKRLTIPEISGTTLRELLGPLFSPENEAELRVGKRVETTYSLPDGTGFLAVFTRRGPATSEPLAFDVVFTRGARRPAVTAPEPFKVATGLPSGDSFGVNPTIQREAATSGSTRTAGAPPESGAGRDASYSGHSGHSGHHGWTTGTPPPVPGSTTGTVGRRDDSGTRAADARSAEQAAAYETRSVPEASGLGSATTARVEESSRPVSSAQAYGAPSFEPGPDGFATREGGLAAPRPRRGHSNDIASPGESVDGVSYARPRRPRRRIEPISLDNAAPLLSLLATAAALGASDLHLLDGEAPSVRVAGALRRLDRVDALVLPDGDPRSLRVDALLGPALGDLEALDDLDDGFDATLDVPSLGRFRVHTYRASRGIAAAIRLLPRKIPSIAELKIPVRIDDLIDMPHGLVLVCGPTGSGKSSTLAALAQEALRRHPKMVVTLEDPIEYVLEEGESGGLVRQRQIGRDAYDFASGLRDALREDPDVILLGELRDSETILLALTAAETGHLVLSTLHSRSASSAIERIIDAVPPVRQSQVRTQLADSLRAVIAQRLIPRADGAGRVPAVEVLRGSHAVGALIREGKTSHLITTMQSGRREGMVPLDRSLADLVRSGTITHAQATANAADPATLMQYLA